MVKMSRGAKHALYGSLFLFIFALIITAAYLLFFWSSPSCEDNVLNQDEESVDCGGVCIDCEVKNFRLIRSEVGIMPISGTKLTLVASLTNLARDYGATGVRYSLDIKSIAGDSLDLIEGETVVLPEAIKYIIEPNLPIHPSDIGRIDFEVDQEFEIVPKDSFVQHDIIIKQAKPTLSEGVMRVDGIVANNTGSDISTLKLNALIRDSQAQLVSAAITVVNQLPAFGSKTFSVFVPVPSDIVLDELKTDILWEVVS